MKTLNVDLGDRSYPIMIGRGLLDAPGSFQPFVAHRQVMVVTNDVVAPLYLERLTRTLSGFADVDVTLLEDGEGHKNLASFERIMDHLLTQRHNRTTTLIALGGGVVGDITGFAAATYQRGVPFIQVPTTLLAMVDSSVGGKTAVNHPQGKNMIGAFHQPRAVVIDTDVLGSLPQRELAAGLAEVIKYGLIARSEFLDWIDDQVVNIQRKEPEALEYMISESCQCKADVVASDETEKGLRAILNLGHTFGHAIEAFCEYKNWLHGEAVAVGMLMATDLSIRLGWLEPETLERLKALLTRLELPVRPPQAMQPEDFRRYMAIDKKVLDGQLRLVLLRSVGEAVVTGQFDPSSLDMTLDAFTQH